MPNDLRAIMRQRGPQTSDPLVADYADMVRNTITEARLSASDHPEAQTIIEALGAVADAILLAVVLRGSTP